MNVKIYNRIVTICLYVTVMSALLFERLGHALAGSIGIIAGIVATLTYFYNQYHEK